MCLSKFTCHHIIIIFVTLNFCNFRSLKNFMKLKFCEKKLLQKLKTQNIVACLKTLFKSCPSATVGVYICVGGFKFQFNTCS